MLFWENGERQAIDASRLGHMSGKVSSHGQAQSIFGCLHICFLFFILSPYQSVIINSWVQALIKTEMSIGQKLMTDGRRIKLTILMVKYFNNIIFHEGAP